MSVVFNAISISKELKMTAAARRLNAASLRADERDRILDITIGLETLLTDDSNSEITYRLSLRMAALVRVQPLDGLSAVQTFRACKQLYKFRSAIAHGSTKRAPKKELSLGSQGTRPIISIGNAFLRHALWVLSIRPQLQTPSNIDARLLGEMQLSPDS
jgi:hypothetical protein